MITAKNKKYQADRTDLNDNSINARLPVSPCGKRLTDAVWGEPSGCIFRVGKDSYFVPTRQTSMDDILYITCDAQIIEDPNDYVEDTMKSRLMLGAMIASDIEDAILKHLHTAKTENPGEAFVVTRGGKTFRL